MKVWYEIEWTPAGVRVVRCTADSSTPFSRYPGTYAITREGEDAGIVQTPLFDDWLKTRAPMPTEVAAYGEIARLLRERRDSALGRVRAFSADLDACESHIRELHRATIARMGARELTVAAEADSLALERDTARKMVESLREELRATGHTELTHRVSGDER